MRSVRSLLCVLVSALFVVSGAQAGSASDGQGCKSINATGVGQDLGGGNTTAVRKKRKNHSFQKKF